MARGINVTVLMGTILLSCIGFQGCSGTPYQAHLAITTASLPTAGLNSAYTATIDASATSGPYTWSIISGTLPAGLSLGTSTTTAVTISGTPTTQGASTFTIKVVDASGAAATRPLSIVVTSLAITTTSPLPAATAGQPYSEQFAATGGTQPYTWAVATGSTLPAGLSLSTSGLLSGTATAPGTFSVTVTDSESPAISVTSSFTLTVTGSGNAALLTGNYAFQFSGFNASGPVAVAGSFHTDGAGNVSAGVEDMTTSTTHNNQTFTGTYTVGSDNRGILTFSSLAGSPTYAFAIDATGAHGRLIEFDSTGVRGSGQLEQQTQSTCAFNTISGEYAIGITGNATAVGGGTPGPVALVGRFTASPPSGASGVGSIGNGEMDANTPGASFPPQQTLVGTYQSTSQSARCIAAISPASLPSMNFSAYPISTAKYFLVQTDIPTVTNPYITVGSLRQQVGYPFLSPSGSLTGTSIAGLTGQYSSGSGSFVPDQAIVSITANGSTTFSITGVENRAGAITNFSTTADFVNADQYGRVQTDLPSPIVPVFYMINQNEAFALGTIYNNPFFGVFEPQSGAPFTNSTLKGTVQFGTAFPAVSSARDISGVLSLDGSQGVTGAQDQSTSAANSPSQAVTGTYSVINTGTGLGTITLSAPAALSGAFFSVTPTQFVVLTTTSSDTNPTLIFGGNWQ